MAITTEGTLLEGLTPQEAEIVGDLTNCLAEASQEFLTARLIPFERAIVLLVRGSLLDLAGTLATNSEYQGAAIDALVDDACTRLRQAAVWMAADATAAGRA